MRSKFNIFGMLLIAVSALAAISFAGVARTHIKANDISKSGHAVNISPATPERSAYVLPPVGSRTRDGSLDEIIISEDFDTVAVGSLPRYWTEVDVDQGYSAQFGGSSVWQVYDYGTFAHSGSNVAMNHYNDNAVPNDDWLILPRQLLGGTITLSYWAASQQQDGSYLEDYEVRVSTTGNQPADFTHLIQDFNQIPVAWTQHTHDLSAYAGAPFYVAFHYNSVDQFVIKIDDVVLEGTQLPLGALAGTVTDDNTHLPLANVNVSLGSGITTTTNAAGTFLFNSVVPDTYTVVYTLATYGTDSLTNIVVTAGDTADADIELHHLNIEFHDYASTAPPSTISDQDTAYMNLDVADNVVISDLDVTINITHTYDSDLTIWLETPWNTRILLAQEVGGSGNNFVDTRFDDEASAPITSGTAPFTGSFQPQESLTDADGQPVTGQWTLVVYDGYAQDTGTIDGFTLHVTSEATAADEPRDAIPSSFAFYGNYPNPFNATTEFRFNMGRAGHASLVLYNVVGQEAARLLEGNLEAGIHAVSFDASDLPSGVYLARFTAPGFASTRKVVLLK